MYNFNFGTVSRVKIIKRWFDFRCVERNRCNDNRDVGGITPFGSSELLTTLINSAQIAACPEAGYVCCNNLFVKIAEPEQKCDTSQGSGYR